MTDALKIDPHETLWVTDAELIRRLGMPEKVARANIRYLDYKRANGWPKKDPLWGGRRYWPAIKAYFDRHAGITMGVSPKERRYG